MKSVAALIALGAAMAAPAAHARGGLGECSYGSALEAATKGDPASATGYFLKDAAAKTGAQWYVSISRAASLRRRRAWRKNHHAWNAG